MKFDQLCGITERHLPKIVPVLEQTKLFVFPGRPQEVLPKEYNQEQIDFIKENFAMPFQMVAIEDSASCIILIDPEREYYGIDKPRYFIECLNMHTDIKEFREGLDSSKVEEVQKSDAILNNMPKDTCVVSFGTINQLILKDNKIECEGSVTDIYLANQRDGIIQSKDDLLQGDYATYQQLTEACLRNAVVAFEEIVYFNSPDRFVVKVTNTKLENKRGPKIPRSDQRPNYILLKPHEIRSTMGLPTMSEGGGVVAHEVRGHYRYLTHERYTAKRFKHIFIPAHWQGVEESVVKNKRYKVCLEI